jgi:hypothetical protein
MLCSKEKWDASGANDAMARMTATIPQGSRDYLTATSSQLFNRQKLRGVTVCFGIGEERPYYIEKSPALLIARVKHNCQFFFLNYMMLTSIIFCLTLLISPSAIIGIVILAALWMYVIRQTQDGSMQVYGKGANESFDDIFGVSFLHPCSSLMCFYSVSHSYRHDD